MQAARLHLPVGRDLRRLPLDVRLRAARRQPPAQRQERLVGVDGAAPRRRGGPGRRHPVATGGVGRVGAPGHLHRPAGGLQEVPPALARGQDRRGVPGVRLDRVHRGPGVQPHVQDPRRPAGGRGRGRLPPPRDGPGHVHQLPQRPADDPDEAAVRHRPGRQVVPQRDHPAELRVPDPGVRADGDGVLRAAGRGRAVVRVLARRALPLVPRPRDPRRRAAAAAPRGRASCPTTRRAPPTSSSCSRGGGTSWRASPTAPTST